VVVASTSGTIGISERPDFVATEDSPTPHDLIARFPYYRTKLYQEQESLAANDDDLAVVVVNPSLLLGPGDVHGSSTRDVWLFLTRAIPATPSGGMAYVDARDAAAGMALAMEHGKPGRRYLLNGSNVSVREFFARLSRLSGVATPAFSLPSSRRVATAATSILSRAVSMIGGELAVDVPTVEMGQLFWYVDSSRAERELGFSTRDPNVTLADTIADLGARRAKPV
jgi:dihydroflavonol-4-reductase